MKTIIKIIFTLFICLMALPRANSQALYLPLDTVLSRIKNNPALTAYNSKVNAQDAFAAGAKNLDAPKLSAGQYQTPYQLSPNSGSFMISGEQLFTNPAKLRAKEDYMKGLSKVTTEEKSYLKNQLIAGAKDDYFGMVISEKKLSVLQKTQSLLEYMLKDAGIRLTYGKEKLSNIYKAKANLFELDNTREQLNNDIRQERIMLNTLMFTAPQTAFDADTIITVKDYETTFTDTSRLINSRSDLQGINRSIELQALNAKMEYSKRKPDFGVQAGHMFSYGGYPNQYILMGSITIPIVSWASREYKSNLKGIKYEVEELQQNKLDILNQAQGRLAVLKTDMASKKVQLNNYRINIIPALQNNYKTALLAYEQNTGDLPSVLDAIKDLQAAEMNNLDLLQELLALQVDYEKENEIY